MKRLLLLVVALILYGSFYPWVFHARVLPANPLWILLHSWPDSVDRSLFRDAAINLTLYVPFGVFCFLSLGDSDARTLRTIATVLGALLLSSSIEMTQLFDAGRVCSLFDVVCNTAGATIGILVAATFPAAIATVVSEAEAAGVFRLSGVIALLYLWAGYRLFPFVPVLSRYGVQSKLTILLGPGAWTARAFFESFGGWLAASPLFESLSGHKRVGRFLAIALLAVPLKLFIAHRTTTMSEMVGALAGAAAWLLLRGLARPRTIAGMLALAALIAGGLLPFRLLAEPQSFTWVPFLPLLQTPWEAAFLILMQKSFLYGSAVWLFNDGGRGWLISSLMVAVPLAIVEALQIYLPGRTPELTDPLLAILMGSSLMLLERHAARHRIGGPKAAAIR